MTSLNANAISRSSRASFVLESEINAIRNNQDAHKSKQAEAGFGDIEDVNVPADKFEAKDALQANSATSSPTVWSKSHFGLLCSYWIVGILQGITSTIYPLAVLVYQKEPNFVQSAAQLITIFWSFKFVYGFLTDFVPIFGYRRKVYIVGGHGIAIAIAFLMVYLSQSFSIEGILAILTLQNFFSVFADVASDGYTVGVAHREHVSIRGKTQTYAYSARFVANLVGALIAGVLMNGPFYGGDFDFEVSVSNVFLIYACCAAVAYPGVIFFLHEDKTLKSPGDKSIFEHLIDSKNILLKRPIYQLIAFTLMNQTLAGMVNNTNSNFAGNVLHMTSFQNSLNTIFQYILLLAGMMIIKTWCLGYDWRKMFAATLLAQVILTNLVFIFIWDVSHDSWLYVVLSATNQLPYGMNFIVASYFMVEIAEPGQEAVTYSILTTVHNLAIPLTTVLSNQIAGAFDNLDNDSIKADTSDFRWDWTYLQIIITCLNALSLFCLNLFPRQKAEARALIQKPSNPALAWFIFWVTICCLIYSVLCNVLTIVPSTQCLKAIGGPGC
eukprot:Nk52_evm12s226 gene=Nk52_evmTU12s226